MSSGDNPLNVGFEPPAYRRESISPLTKVILRSSISVSHGIIEFQYFTIDWLIKWTK